MDKINRKTKKTGFIFFFIEVKQTRQFLFFRRTRPKKFFPMSRPNNYSNTTFLTETETTECKP